MRGGGRGRQIRTKMELRTQEDNPEEQRRNADALRVGLHVLSKTKLRREWLQGQAQLVAACRGPVPVARKDQHGALRRGRFVVRSIRCQLPDEKFLKKIDGGGFANPD